ncbi:hypothetical protein ABMA27_000498 [Loxostege sticticalis]|uniref:Cilia- and flagella-associated protein 69 ARM repeats domain-containing protein n=1 Tax=Loxostege sticticalis TaxID=481309 RepID=A0ABR3INL9_LOXSC
MDKKRTPFTSTSPPPSTKSSKSANVPNSATKSPDMTSTKSANKSPEPKPKKRAKGDCLTSSNTSGTQYFRREGHGDAFGKRGHGDAFQRIDSSQYVGLSESISGSSLTFNCVHGPEGKQYTDKGLLKRNLLKELDPIPVDKNWTEKCPPAYGWEIGKKLEFLVTDPVGVDLSYRLDTHLRDFAKVSYNGYKIDTLSSLSIVLDYLVENYQKQPSLRGHLLMLLVNMEKPVMLNVASDVITYFEALRSYIGFLGFLLMRLEDDDLFTLVSNALIWQLSAPDCVRGAGTAHLRHVLAAAVPVLYQTTVRMLAVANAHRFPTFLEIALLLACESVENCIEMMKENIIENIFYRFNPYFPERKLPAYDINPADPQDFNVKLGDSSVNMTTTLSLLLVLVKTTKEFVDENPHYRKILPCPDVYSQRCFIWAYRYECRAREHQSERTTLTVFVAVLLHCFGDRLTAFSALLMPDVMSMSVLTELPPRGDWIRTVNFSTGQLDVQFKKILINLCVDFLKVYPNSFLVESRFWLMGLMYLIDPGLCYLRAKWSPALFAELRKTALQALVCVLPLTPPKLAREYGLTRRIMWYIEWYSESPYELPVLYWCVRLLQVIIYNRDPKDRRGALQDLFDTHGVIIIIHLCYTLLKQKTPPVEKSQVIIALCLRLLTQAVDMNKRLMCCVYPAIKWPCAVNALVKKMLDVVLFSLDKQFIVNDRWLVALLNLIWEGVIWKPEYRAIFLANNGIYKLLDLIAMTKAPVQCIALAMVCDVATAGDAVGQLVSWRATVGASNAQPMTVKRGATIATLLAAIFKDECNRTGVKLDENGILQDLHCPLMSADVKKAMEEPGFRGDKSQRTTVCYAAADLAGSRLSKTFALLHLLSEDLKYIVSLADEAYNMYKNIKLAPEDESVLVLCSHYFTVKLNEVWLETQIQCPGLLPHDNDVLGEFLQIGRGWAKEIQRQQGEVIEKDRKKEFEEECSLYAFLARVRLNIALDALREVRCVARSGDRSRMTHALIHDAVLAHHRRSLFAKKLEAPVLRTYGPSLDDQNITGQYVKVYSIQPKDKPKPREHESPPS